MSVGVAAKIEEILQDELVDENAENAFREIFCNELGFVYDNSLVLIDGLDDIILGELKSIAKTTPTGMGKPYHIIYGETEKITKTKRRKLVKEIVNYFSYKEEGAFILILYDRARRVWELITYARLLGRIQLRIYRVGPGEAHRTTAENLAKLKLETPDIGRTALAKRVEEAFRVEPVTDQFFDDYKKVIEDLIKYIKQTYRVELESKTPAGVTPELFIHRSAKTFAHILMNRLMFIMFLQKKGWMGGRKDFLGWLYEEIYRDCEGDYEFYRDFLRPLFLDVLNKPSEEKKRLVEDMNIPDVLKEIYKNIHYYNGGLFNPVREFGVNLDEIITEFKGDGDQKIEGVMEFLLKYNFTISEESPFEVEVAVDPAMLGRIYEKLIAEEERGAGGIFYTHPEEVDFMCRMALYNHLSKVADAETVIKVLFSEEPVTVPREIIDELEKLRVVDPASGSGAFLVGMFNVIREIYEKAGITVDFERKKKIIMEVLHGVDVKEWAMRVAELRLWLALIEDEDEMPNYEPLLPNLTPNLRVGDSLVSEGIPVGDFTIGGVKIDGIPVSIEFTRDMLNALGRRRKEIVKLKRRVFNGEMSVVEYERERVRLFVEAVAGGFQSTLFDGITAESAEVERLKRAHEEGKEIQIPFFWEFDFADVMEEGFDVVIANPPYVRQENIYPEFFDQEELGLLPVDEGRLKKAYKQAIINNIEKIVDSKIKNKNEKSDIYAYFFMKGIDILKNGGTLVFITSNSWLDVKYGTWMQEEFLKKTHLKFVFDYPHRSFEDADVNTIITVMEKKEETLLDPESKVKFTKLKEKKIGELDYENFKEILTTYSGGKKVNVFGAEVESIDGSAARYRVVDEVNLARLGEATVQRAEMSEAERYIFTNYQGAKWGGLLIRAPEIFYTILRKGEGKLVKLGDIADVETYLNTGGADKFFIVKKINDVDDCCFEIENTEYHEKFLVEKIFLRPLVKSPRFLSERIVKENGVDYILYIPSEMDISKYSAYEYVRFGESVGYSNRSGPRSREPWWKLPKQAKEGAPILFPRTFDIDFSVFYNPNRIISNRFFRLVNIKIDETCLYLSLNSTISYFSIEVFGRKNLGEGALEFLKPDIENLPLFLISQKCDVNMLDASRKSIFEELGLPRPNKDYSNIKPEDVTLEGVMPDRRELDRIIFEALGLTEEEQLEVYHAVVELVKERLVKAKSKEENKNATRKRRSK